MSTNVLIHPSVSVCLSTTGQMMVPAPDAMKDVIFVLVHLRIVRSVWIVIIWWVRVAFIFTQLAI